MKISEAISRLDSLKSNTFGQEEKVQWLSELDWRVKREIIDTHEGWEDIPFDGYQGSEPLETELLVRAPWDAVYLRWMEAMVDYHNGELDKYKNSHALFNTAWEEYAAWYNRTYMPLRTRVKYFGGRNGS